MKNMGSQQQIDTLAEISPDIAIYTKKIEALRLELSQCQKESTKKDKEIRQLMFKLKNGKGLTNEVFDELNNRVSQLELDIIEKDEKIEKLNFEIQRLESKIENHRKKLLEYENYKKENDIKVQELQKTIKDMTDIHMIYIGQIAYKFCKQAYCFVLGEGLYEEYHPQYFMDELDGIIDEIQDKDQKEQALNNWEKLKSVLAWKREVATDLKNLRQERNFNGHPKVEKEKALEAIEELNSNRRLLGKISFSKVNNILKMWEISCSFVPDYIVESTY